MWPLLFSFFALVSIPLIFSTLIPFCLCKWRKKPIEKPKDWIVSGLTAVGITVVITLARSGIMKSIGFFDATFFRPSNKDYGEIGKLPCEVQRIEFSSVDQTKIHGYSLRAM